jgi:hypothetical protein
VLALGLELAISLADNLMQAWEYHPPEERGRLGECGSRQPSSAREASKVSFRNPARSDAARSSRWSSRWSNRRSSRRSSRVLSPTISTTSLTARDGRLARSAIVFRLATFVICGLPASEFDCVSALRSAVYVWRASRLFGRLEHGHGCVWPSISADRCLPLLRQREQARAAVDVPAVLWRW